MSAAAFIAIALSGFNACAMGRITRVTKAMPSRTPKTTAQSGA
jgi:hypothetical protein